MNLANLQRIIRQDTIFCRFYLQFNSSKRTNASLAIDKLLIDLSRFGDILYEKPNEKFIKPNALPLKIDLAICSPDKVKLTKLITNIRGYVYTSDSELDYSSLTSPIASEVKADLQKTIETLYSNARQNYPNDVLRIPNEPFVFLNNPITFYRTLSGETKDIHKRELFKWVYLNRRDKSRISEDNTNQNASFRKRFIDFPSNKPVIQIVPCLFQNLTELPNEMNNWLRIPEEGLQGSAQTRLSTLFHGFTGF